MQWCELKDGRINTRHTSCDVTHYSVLGGRLWDVRGRGSFLKDSYCVITRVSNVVVYVLTVKAAPQLRAATCC